MGTMPTLSPDADLQLQLVSDIGPELIPRWAEAPTMYKNVTTPVMPAMFRACISATLRAASVVDADDFESAHHSLMTSRVVSDKSGAVLGFASDTSSYLRVSVLNDLLQSASTGSPLLPESPALTFYSTAGAGAGDSGEYYDATVDNRASFCGHADLLRDVRVHGLAQVLHVYARAIRQGLAECFDTDAVHQSTKNTLLTPYIGSGSLIDNIDERDSVITEALHDFYDAYYTQCSVAKRHDITAQVVSAVLRVALTREKNVLPFVNGMRNPELRLNVSRLCLVQRFGVREKPDALVSNCNLNEHHNVLLSRPLTASVIIKQYLSVSPKSGRPNSVFPGLLAVLIFALELTHGNSAFEVPSNVLEQYLETISRSRAKSWSSFRAHREDVVALRLALVRLAQKILSCTSGGSDPKAVQMYCDFSHKSGS